MGHSKLVFRSYCAKTIKQITLLYTTEPNTVAYVIQSGNIWNDENSGLRMPQYRTAVYTRSLSAVNIGEGLKISETEPDTRMFFQNETGNITAVRGVESISKRPEGQPYSGRIEWQWNDTSTEMYSS